MKSRRAPHRRRNALTGEWVLVSPQRTQRPWQGQEESAAREPVAAHDEACYLCPGNARANGEHNPLYNGPFAFDNDFPALLNSSCDAQTVADSPLHRQLPETGRCRVLCFSERHDRHLADMDADEVGAVLKFMFGECHELDKDSSIGYVQLFENRGQMMGASNPHPHAQVWATSGIPNEPAREAVQQQDWFDRHGSALLLDYLADELDCGDRVVFVNETAAVLVPFWATWPFELLLLPRVPLSAPDGFSADALQGFAGALQRALQALDGLFGVPMPYSMGFHPRPSDGGEYPGWQFHGHIYPPLLRSASVRKHMVGFEMLGMPQRDLTPEEAAERLRAVIRQ